VGLQTMISTNEMRALRLGDVYPEQKTLQVRNEGAKNRFRVRTVPLPSHECVLAIQELAERARRLGANGPFSYLFPRHITADRYDATRPMSVWGLRKPWDEVRSASGIDWVTPYCLRHTGATRAAESGMPIHVLMSIMGHCSRKMQEHYVTVSMMAQRSWAAAAWATNDLPPRKGPMGERRMEDRRSGDRFGGDNACNDRIVKILGATR